MSCNKIIDSVVNAGYCIGCGACTYQCKNKNLTTKINSDGFYEVYSLNSCNNDCDCNSINVCPFNPTPEDIVKNENSIAKIFLTTSQKDHKKIGHYNNIYAGYSKKYRATSSSGGIATYALAYLLKNKLIKYIITVQESNLPGNYYEYKISNSIEEITATSKTRYSPVTLEDVLKKINSLDGNVAIVGVGCFIKSIRLLQYYNPELKEKISFLVGIICGGVKSKFFTEYLANKINILPEDIHNPEYRIKDPESSANDYSFGCFDKDNRYRTIKMKTVGDMWGTGLFKANACDFCDDVTTELADISVGDAWLKPYSDDGYGCNVIVTRSIIADEIIKYGINNNELEIHNISEDIFISSQRGSYNHRQDALHYRIQKNKKMPPPPPKRIINTRISILEKLIQNIRMSTRKKSLIIWKKNKNSKIFDKKMHSILLLLRIVTKINHLKRRLFK